MRRAATAAARVTAVAVTALLLAVIGGVGLAVGAGSAAGSDCPTTLAISGPTGLALTLTPASARSTVGQCVAVTNDTRMSVTVRAVRSGEAAYGPVVLAAGATDSGFTPGTAGQVTVHATVSAAQVVVYSGIAHLTVAAAKPSASPTPSRTASPTPTRSARPSASPSVRPSSSATTRPSATATATRSGSPSPSATGIVLPTFPSLPPASASGLILGSNPLVAGQPSSAPPTGSASAPLPPTASAAVVAGVIEPVGDDRRGLPVAVAVVLLLGLATGIVRVALAYPPAVDNVVLGAHRL